MFIRLKTAHGTWLRAGDQGEVNQTTITGPWEVFEVVAIGSVTPDPKPSDRVWNGNFLACPGQEYETNPAETAFRAVHSSKPVWLPIIREYRAYGYTHLPLSIDDSHIGGRKFSPEQFRTLMRQLRDEGILPVPFLFGAADEWRWSIEQMRAYLEDHLPVWGSVCWGLCLGWEPGPLLFAETAHELTSIIREHVGPDKPVYYHGSPHWWGPPYMDGVRNEHDFWRETSLTGHLHQYAPSDPIDWIKRDLYTDEDRRPLGGMVGRLALFDKDFVLFEHSRNYTRWVQVTNLVKGDQKVKGWC